MNMEPRQRRKAGVTKKAEPKWIMHCLNQGYTPEELANHCGGSSAVYREACRTGVVSEVYERSVEYFYQMLTYREQAAESEATTSVGFILAVIPDDKWGTFEPLIKALDIKIIDMGDSDA